MRQLVSVGEDPCALLESRVLDGGEAVAPAELLVEGLDEAFAESILFGRVGRDELLLDVIVADHDAELA